MTRERTRTVLPCVVAMLLAVVAMPTKVVNVQAWRGTLANVVTRGAMALRDAIARMRAGLQCAWGHPWRGPALAAAAMGAMVLCGEADMGLLVAVPGLTPAAARYLVDRAPAHMRALLTSGLSVAEMRANSPLEEDAQKLVDQAVVRVGLDRLTIAADVMAAGLTFPLANPMSVMELQWEVVSEAGGAQRTMLPRARGENQLQGRDVRKIPIYLTTEDFSVNRRLLLASERNGAPIDTALVEQATRRVNEAIEDSVINGAAVTVAGSSTPGLLNAPNVNAYAYSSNEAWDAAGHNGEDILGDVQGMIDLLQADKRYGPYHLYVPTSYGNKLNEDFKAHSDKTILQRLQEIQVGGRTLMVKTADLLPTNRTAMVQMTSDVIDIIDGQRPVVVPWTSPDGFVLFWMVMAIIVPRVRDDYDGKSGICVGHTTV